VSAMRILGGVDAAGQGISVGVDNGVQGSAPPDSPYIDATGLTVVPGFIDIQVNGAFGMDFTQDPDTIWDVGSRLPETGVTSFCPTIITSPHHHIVAAQNAIAARPAGYVGAEPIGLHIEGPHLSESKRGTHPVEHLKPPAESLLETDHVTIVTLAPELPGAVDLITSLVERGVVVSIGHSAATADEARTALDAGATLGTHLFNAMPPITAREPGIAGVLLADKRAFFGVIVDGVHHDPAAVSLAWNAAPGRFVLITDAMAAAAMPDGDYRIGQIDVTVADRAVRDREGNLAGSVSTMDHGLAVLMEMCHVGLREAIVAATFNPSEAIKRWDMGRLQPGTRADLTLLDGLNVVCTVVGGHIAYLADDSRWKGQPHVVA
jgi:N-acetylglucosamine-6-phosphate deacetylase